MENQSALEKLKNQYEDISLSFQEDIENAKDIIVYHWPGTPGEDIILSVHQSFGIEEPFHIHDYFHFLYAYKGDFEMRGSDSEKKIKLCEGDMYAGQPSTGHALCAHDDEETIIVGLIIQKSAFFREFLQPASTDSNFFHFLIDRVNDLTSDRFMHLKLQYNKTIRDLLKIMVREYANPKSNTKDILKPLVVSFLLEVAREYSEAYPVDLNPVMRIIMYIDAHLRDASLINVAEEFSYHPNYLTTLLRKEVGKSFSKILTELRMNRAAILLKDTNLTVNEIAKIVGYTNSSNFHKAFKNYYGILPKEFGNRTKNKGAS